MTPYEVMLSECQERMLLIAKPEHADDVRALFERWELHCAEIGHVTAGDEVVLLDGGVEVGRLPVQVATDPPEYTRGGIRNPELRELNEFDPVSLPDVEPARAGNVLLELLARPGLASKRGVYRQYDQQVLGNTVVLPGGDAAVLRVRGSDRGIAIATDCNARLCYLDPYTGGALAVAEAARNVVCTGAVPVAVTDCLNFGNPERPEVYYQLEQAVRGIAQACTVFGTPVVSGNVSLFNESAGRAVYPTPVVGMLGVLEDVSHHLQAAFVEAGSEVFLIGLNLEQTAATIGGSEYLEAVHGRVAGMPSVDLEGEQRLHRLVLALHAEGLLLSAHDCSEGGLAVTLVESAILGGFGFNGSQPNCERLDAGLFGEGQGRIVVSLVSGDVAAARLDSLAVEHEVGAMSLGRVTSERRFRLGPINLGLDELSRAYDALLE